MIARQLVTTPYILFSFTAEKVKRDAVTRKSLLKEITELRQRNDMLQASQPEMVELVPGAGLKIPAKQLNTYRAAKNHQVLIRNLFRHFFTREQLLTHTLSGRGVGVNRNANVLPELDPNIKNIIFGKTFIANFNMAFHHYYNIALFFRLCAERGATWPRRFGTGPLEGEV
jgi:hypothetical protein